MSFVNVEVATLMSFPHGGTAPRYAVHEPEYTDTRGSEQVDRRLKNIA